LPNYSGHNVLVFEEINNKQTNKHVDVITVSWRVLPDVERSEGREDPFSVDRAYLNNTMTNR